MRIAFLIVLLAGAIFYTYIAFADLNFLTRTGRLGPGFFPRMIGVTAVVILLWAILDELRSGEISTDGSPRQWRDVVTLIALALGFAVLIRLFGGYISTFLFLMVTLAVLNRGKLVSNTAVAVAIPGFVYILFDKVLNANMPPALFELPL